MFYLSLWTKLSGLSSLQELSGKYISYNVQIKNPAAIKVGESISAHHLSQLAIQPRTQAVAPASDVRLNPRV
jgi:3-deoxy-D-arabino-heptulosonate 7-phosphate (DAHP) synthase class II